MPPHIESAVPEPAPERKNQGEKGKDEILINGRWYDITTFARKHPGGKVISFMTGIDGTNAFEEFHLRSERAQKMLKALPSRPHNEKSSSLLEDYEELRKQLEKEGLFDPSIPHVIYRTTELVLLHALGIYLVAGGFSLPVIILGLVILGIAQGQCGWYMHEAGHYSLTGNIAIDKTLQEIVYGTGCGMSGGWWRSQHNRHHATPQKIQHDVDLETLPLVAFNQKIAARIPKNSSFYRLWISLQAYLFAPLTTLLVAFSWQFILHPRHIVRKRLLTEAIALFVRYYAIFFLILKDYPFSTAFAMYSFYVWIGAMYIFVTFAVSHTHKEVLGKDRHVDWVRYAGEYTTNCTPSWWCNWWMGYLNFQIEHHLFPCIPQFRHPLIAPRVKRLFAKHAITYDCRSYWECLRVTFQNLNQVAAFQDHQQEEEKKKN